MGPSARGAQGKVAKAAAKLPPKRPRYRPKTRSTPDKKKRRGPAPDPRWHKAFLDSLRNHGIVKRACLDAGIYRAQAYAHRKNDPAFAEQWDEAEEESTCTLEMELIRRARDGTEVPIMRDGECVGTAHKVSDQLLLAALKARKPRVYRERFEHTGDGGGPIQHAVFTKEELDEYRRRVAEALEGEP